ncbi:hypothetical protein [Aquipuribacter sp. MA13-6]|uniref:hypothetical protein n=1 Tax=unclassified Aquipuribacter TaxID=2635084 RepID=UPI003EF006C4
MPGPPPADGDTEPTSPPTGTVEPEPARCSAKGCRSAAVWALRWNNPALHTPERRKLWAACEAHREHLSQFLGARGFLRDVVPLAEAEPDPGPTPPAGPVPDRAP